MGGSLIRVALFLSPSFLQLVARSRPRFVLRFQPELDLFESQQRITEPPTQISHDVLLSRTTLFALSGCSAVRRANQQFPGRAYVAGAFPQSLQ